MHAEPLVSAELTWESVEAATAELPPPTDRAERAFMTLIADLRELVNAPSIDKGPADQAIAQFDGIWARYARYTQDLSFIPQNRRTRQFMPRMPELERQARLLRAQDAMENASFLRAEIFHKAEAEGVVLGRGQL